MSNVRKLPGGAQYSVTDYSHEFERDRIAVLQSEIKTLRDDERTNRKITGTLMCVTGVLPGMGGALAFMHSALESLCVAGVADFAVGAVLAVMALCAVLVGWRMATDE